MVSIAASAPPPKSDLATRDSMSRIASWYSLPSWAKFLDGPQTSCRAASTQAASPWNMNRPAGFARRCGPPNHAVMIQCAGPNCGIFHQIVTRKFRPLRCGGARASHSLTALKPPWRFFQHPLPPSGRGHQQLSHGTISAALSHLLDPPLLVLYVNTWPPRSSSCGCAANRPSSSRASEVGLDRPHAKRAWRGDQAHSPHPRRALIVRRGSCGR